MSVVSDLRYALRLLARSPIFTLTAVLSLSMGMAASAAIFSLEDAVMLRPRVGVSNPATLIDIGRTTNGEGFDNFGYPAFEAMRARSTLVDGITAQRTGPEVMSLTFHSLARGPRWAASFWQKKIGRRTRTRWWS